MSTRRVQDLHEAQRGATNLKFLISPMLVVVSICCVSFLPGTASLPWSDTALRLQREEI